MRGGREGERERGGGREGGREGEGGVRVLRSRSSCQIVCNISRPPVSCTQLDRLSSLNHDAYLSNNYTLDYQLGVDLFVILTDFYVSVVTRPHCKCK